MVNTKSLLRVLKLSAPALLTKDFLPVLTHFCMDGSVLYSFNDRTAIIADFGVEGLKCAVPGKQLLEMLNGMADEINLDLTNGTLVLKDKKSRFRLATLPGEAFVYEAPRRAKLANVSLTPALAEILAFAAACSHNEHMNQSIMGVTLSTGKGKATVTCTDNITVTHAETETDANVVSTVIIPKQGVELICGAYRMLAGEVKNPLTATLQIGESAVIASFDSTEGKPKVVNKPIPAEPANFSTSLALKKSAKYMAVPVGLEQALKKVLVLQSADLTNTATLTVSEKGNLLLTAKSDMGDLSINLGAAKGQPQVNRTFDPIALIRSLEKCNEIALTKDCIIMRGVGEGWAIDQLICELEEPIREEE